MILKYFAPAPVYPLHYHNRTCLNKYIGGIWLYERKIGALSICKASDMAGKLLSFNYGGKNPNFFFKSEPPRNSGFSFFFFVNFI